MLQQQRHAGARAAGLQAAQLGEVVRVHRQDEVEALEVGSLDLARPQATAPAQTPPLNTSGKGVAWAQQYEMRAIDGAFPSTWDGSGEHSRTRLWLRDAQPRALDFPALAAMSDIFYPRVWLRRATPVPAGTVSITTYFHTDAAQLAEVGSGYLLGEARGQAFRNGYFDQAAELWSEAGELLATSNQIVYYKQ